MPKHKPHTANNLPEVAVAWFHAKDYPRILEICTDGESMEAIHEEWRAKAERAITSFREAGAKPHKVAISPESFLAWCEARAQTPNSAARSRYAAHLLSIRRGRGGD